jgi:tetratricopeptide (TPR) repeat protein
MKTKNLKALGLAVVTVVGFSACTGLGKMYKKAAKVTYTVSPNPLEEHGDSVMVTVNGKYPEKYFGKKVNLTFTPKLKWAGGEKDLKPMTLSGEKVKDAKGKVIPYKTGGSFTYTDKIPYQPGMDDHSQLYVEAKGQVKKKTKDMPEMKMADGVIITPMLVKSDEMPIMGKDKFVKVVPMSLESEIFFVISQSNVRPGEMNSEQMKSLKKFIEWGMTNQFIAIKNMSISAYASPDGETDFNENLAGDRAKSSINYFMKTLMKEKKTKYDAGQQESFYSTTTTAEDWAGFEKLVKESTDPKIVNDRDVILGVLKMYPDLQVREKEIKNLSKTYTTLADKILPKLRRSVNSLNYDKKSRTDDMIKTMMLSSPDSLSVEEFLYGAGLTNDLNTKVTVYKNAKQRYGSDWRTSNNLGCVYLMQNKLNEAKAEFDNANKLSANNPVVLNNLGICARWSGDRKMAADYYKQANGAGPEVMYNQGIVDIMNGNYAGAVGNFGSYKTFNVALALLLSGNTDGASQTLDASKEKDDALSYYLRAVIGARTGKTDQMINNLKTAIQKDASFKEKAKKDMEFFKYKDNADLKGIIG